MTDDELMKKIAKGDERAFKALFDRHSGKVFGYARRLMGDPDRAEDVSQEVWMKIVKVAPSYRPTSHFIAWVYTIVRNTSFNTLRGLKTLKEDTTEDIYESDRAEFAAAGSGQASAGSNFEKSSIEELIVKEEDARKIRSVINELPENQRVLLTAWMTEDLSYEELAREAGLSVSAVKSLLFRAKRSLEKSLKGVL